MIDLCKGCLICALCSIKISCNRRTITLNVDYAMSNYKHPRNLGGHNILLEGAYDQWARNGF